MDHPFRSAALGGFNRQDVLAFLEEQSRQSAQAQQKLSEQLEEAGRQSEGLRQEKEELSSRLEEAQRELEAVRQERDGLKVRLERAGRDLAASQAQTDQKARELEETRRKLEQALTERDGVRAELDRTLPGAQAYLELKERTAGVELDAHRRAQAIQEKAEYDAQRVRGRLEKWLRCMEKEYDAMRGEVETTVSHASSELDRVRAGLSRIMQLMDSQENALEGISQVYSETAGPKPEAPMPIDVE